MAGAEVAILNRRGEGGLEDPAFFLSPIFDPSRKSGGADKEESRGKMIERKIEFLESLAGKVSNRRSRRWINDRLLMELVPRLNAEEIRGLFAPPPWGDDIPPSPFAMTNCAEWDAFRNINMDTEAHMIKNLGNTFYKSKGHTNADKIIALKAWHRVGCQTREVLRRNFLSDIVQGYEDSIRDFIYGSGDEEVLVLHVQDPFRRLLLHGVCKFYDLISVTETISEDSKMSKVTKIRKRNVESQALPPHISLVGFLKMARDGSL